MISRIFILLTIRIGDLFFKYSIFKQIKNWKTINRLSAKDLKQLEKENLTHLLKHTVSKTSFYKSKGINLTENPFEDISQFPILTKQVLKENFDDLISENFNKEQLLASYSSGSSGEQSKILMSKQERSSNWGILLNIWKEQGYDFGNRIIQTGITPDRGLFKSIKDLFFKTVYINAFSHSYDELKSILLKYSKEKNVVIIGYASSLNVMSEVIIKEKITFKAKSVISFGDKLFEHYKRNIQKAFQTKVRESYGSNEGFMIAFQKDLDYMYIINPHVYVEILDDNNNPVPDGEMGHIVVTRLDCYSMPLIRYKLGDLGIKLPKEKYPKNRKFNYPLLQKVVGRETDIVVLPDQTKMVVHSFTGIFEYIPEIKQFKVVQRTKNGIEIEYIKAASFSEKAIEKATFELRKYIEQEEFKIEFKEVDFIAPTASGKPQIIESHLL